VNFEQMDNSASLSLALHLVRGLANITEHTADWQGNSEPVGK